MANLTFTRDSEGLSVALDNNSRTTTRWMGLVTMPIAVLAAWRHVEDKLTTWSV